MHLYPATIDDCVGEQVFVTDTISALYSSLRGRFSGWPHCKEKTQAWVERESKVKKVRGLGKGRENENSALF